MLNASYAPLSVVPVRRAIVLVLRERADVVASNGAVWRSERMKLSAPSVIRLRHFVKIPYSRRVPLNRKTVFHRDIFKCQYCGRQAENLDHVIPKSQGWKSYLGERGRLLPPLQYEEGWAHSP